ncbi:MAG TPA: ABC transporter ATP-binding protein [Thermomicrobiales bacterium]|nr:ABC transporter ATP-binding protein [Thermomicrobiales bacterium]
MRPRPARGGGPGRGRPGRSRPGRSRRLNPEDDVPVTPETIRRFPWRRLWRYTRDVRGRMLISAIALLVSSGTMIAFPALIGDGIGHVIERGSRSDLNLLVLTLLGVFFAGAVANYVNSYMLSFTGQTINRRIREDVFGKIVGLDAPFHATHRSGELASRLSNDTTTLQSIFTGMLPSLLSGLLGLVGTIVVMIGLNPQLTLFMFISVPAIMIVAITIGRRLERLATAGQDQLAAVNAQATEVFTNLPIVKSFTAETYETNRYENALSELFAINIRNARYSAANVALITFLAFSGIAGVVWFAGRQVIDGQSSIGTITTFLIYGIQIAMNFGQLSSLFTQFKQASGASLRVFEILDSDLTVPEPEHPRPLAGISPTIAFDDVSFRYGADLVLDDVSFTVGAGETVALVGPSGAGKSTIVELLQRSYLPEAGTIRLGGIDISEVTSHDVRSEMAVVSQMAPLFKGTVRANIAYGKQEATEAEIVAAAKAAQAHEFIERLPEGYDTELGDNGAGISGGQRQRLAIARAMVKRAPFLLLDEATSALDNTNEALVQQALNELMRDTTTLVVAHRLTTIEGADRIVVLDEGRVIEEGTHIALLAKGGFYADLHARTIREHGEGEDRAIIDERSPEVANIIR